MKTSSSDLVAKRARILGPELAAVMPESDKAWVRQPHLLKLNFYILTVLLSSVALGFDGSMMNALLSLDTWNDYFGSPRTSLLGLMNAALSVGGLLVSFPAGGLADKYGRLFNLKLGTVILIIGAVLQGAAQDVPMFIIARFLIGIGIQLCLVVSPVLVTELAYPLHRGKITALYNAFFYLGSIASSWITFGTVNLTNSWSWRIPSLLQGLAPLIQLVCVWWVPESPRWLASIGREKEAREFFVKHHAKGDANHPLVDFEMQELNRFVQDEMEMAKIRWSSLWATKADRKRLFIIVAVPIISQWCGNGLLTYYLALVLDSVGITDSFTQVLINGILQIFNGLAAVLGSMLVDRLGRRTLWLWSCVGMLLSYIAWTACSAVNYETGSSSTGILTIVFIFLFYFHYDIAVTPFTWSYPAEILPYYTRSRGMALVNFLNGVTLLFNAFVNSIAIAALEWRYYIVYCVFLAVILVVVFLFFPETRGRSLEEIAELFEDDKHRAWRTTTRVTTGRKQNLMLLQRRWRREERSKSSSSLKQGDVVLVEEREDVEKL